MTILLAGATGLIGTHFLSLAAASGGRVVALGRNRPAGAGDFIACDLGQPLDERILPAGITTVIYLAQSEHFRDFPRKGQDILTVNTLNPQVLLRWAQANGVQRFIYASSGGVYGHGPEPFREEQVPRVDGPLGYYLTTKRCSELLIENYAALLTVVILRFFFVYGPGQRPGMLIPRLVASVRDGSPVTLQGRDGIRINPLYVTDAARALEACCRLVDSTCINLAGPQTLDLRAIAEEIGRQCGGRKPNFATAEGEPRHLIGDISRMRKLLSDELTSFPNGLASYLASPPTT